MATLGPDRVRGAEGTSASGPASSRLRACAHDASARSTSMSPSRQDAEDEASLADERSPVSWRVSSPGAEPSLENTDSFRRRIASSLFVPHDVSLGLADHDSAAALAALAGAAAVDRYARPRRCRPRRRVKRRLLQWCALLRGPGREPWRPPRAPRSKRGVTLVPASVNRSATDRAGGRGASRTHSAEPNGERSFVSNGLVCRGRHDSLPPAADLILRAKLCLSKSD